MTRILIANCILIIFAIGSLWAHDGSSPLSARHKTGQGNSASPQLPRMVTEQGHFSAVLDCIYLRDDRNIVTAGEDHSAILWDRISGRELRRFEGHTKEIRSVAVDRTNRLLLTGSDDGTAKLWDVSTGVTLKTFPVSDVAVMAVQFSKDGRKFFTASLDKKLRVWVASQMTPVATFDIGLTDYGKAAFSEDGTTLVVSYGDNTAKVFEPESGVFLRPLKSEKQTNLFPSEKVSVSDDGSLAAIQNERGEGSRVYDLHTGQVLWRPSTHFDVVSFDRQNERVIGMKTELKPGELRKTTNDELINYDADEWGRENMDVEVQVYDAHTGHPISHSIPEFFVPSAITFDKTGSEVLVGDGEGSARLLQVPSLQPIRHLMSRTRRIFSLTASPISEIVVATNGSNVAAWDLEAGVLRPSFGPKVDVALGGRFTADGSKLVVMEGNKTSDGSTTHYWDMTTQVDSKFDYKTGPGSIFAIRDDEKLAVDVDGVDSLSRRSVLELGVFDPAKPKIFWPILLPSFRNAWGPPWPLFAPDGETVFCVYDSRLSKVSTRHKREVWLSPQQSDEISSMSISHDGRKVLTGGWDNTARLWDAETGKELKELLEHKQSVDSVALSPDGQWAATGSDDKTAKLWKISDRKSSIRKSSLTLEGHQGSVSAVEFIPNSDYIATGSVDGTVRLWGRNNGRLIATLIQFEIGHWAIVAPDGRFDTNDLDSIVGLHWVFGDDPFTPLPPDIYMRDFYEPKLLPRLLKGKATDLKPLPPLQSLNRAQPKITDIRVSPVQNDQTVTVEVDVEGGEFPVELTGKKYTTGAYDLRLLRDGQLVGEFPKPKIGTPTGTAADDSHQWQKDTCVTPFGTHRTVVFRSVKLPHGAELQQVDFTAYAFNEDRVRGKVGEKEAPALPGVAERKAYIISVGVNDYGGLGWDLQYGAKDARRMVDVLYPRLRSSGYTIEDLTTLVSDDTKEDATKNNISAAIERVANLSTPDDLVIVFFSGHGYSDAHSAFYMLPSDSQPGRMKWSHLSPVELKRFISSEDLSRWFENMVAAEIVLIIDACHSAASVESEGFKPGPLGAQGLGQLAYDKRMRVLAASQTDQAAREMGGQIGEGVLTYALLHDGLEARKAAENGSITLRSWLEYPIKRVPVLFKQIEAGNVDDYQVARTRDVEPAAADVGGMNRKGAVQVPALFDFARSGGVVSPGPSMGNH
jgi:WD40 repeat protein